MTKLDVDRLTAVGAAAILAGAATTPVGYILLGAASSFSIWFSLLFLVPALIGSTYLLIRYFSGPDLQPPSRAACWREVLSWIAIAAFVVLASRFRLQTVPQRLALVSLFLLVGFIVHLAALSLRDSSIRQRMARWPRWCRALFIVGSLSLAMALCQWGFHQAKHLI